MHGNMYQQFGKKIVMAKVALQLGEKGRGAFLLLENDIQIGEMVIGISDQILTVYHTEVDPQYEGKGLAKTLLEAMVQYARQSNLKVLPLCPYVHAQFKRHPDLYMDVWNQQEGKN